MAQVAGPPPTELQAQQSVPFWRDTRILGVFGQIGFIVLAILFFRLITTNFAGNVDKLGESQFICRDGTFSYLCAYNFIYNEAGFDLGDTVIEYVNTDPNWFAFRNGILNKLKVDLLATVLCTIVGLFTGIAHLSKNWLVKNWPWPMLGCIAIRRYCCSFSSSTSPSFWPFLKYAKLLNFWNCQPILPIAVCSFPLPN
jgi:ABC-type amino acid transport system permease subunit